MKVFCFFLVAVFILLNQTVSAQYLLGNQQTNVYFPLLKGKKVGVLVNQTSMVNQVHLVDTLLTSGIEVVKVFSPEHGFRGDADAGEKIGHTVDEKTGLPIISLYGSNKKPTAEQLKGLDWVVFDVQDVGVRFYTYISTLHYLMEACAENGIGVMVLDRPNPNGDYVDGPVLEKGFESFVGMHPIPIVHGLTVGELAKMINGEGWLKNGVKCTLKVIEVSNYAHCQKVEISQRPSPNLPNYLSIRLYSSLCFFEGTSISVGRGTYYPFQVIGYPDSLFGSFSFVPVSIVGMAKSPLHQDKNCFGIDLREQSDTCQFTLAYLIHFYKLWNRKEPFFSNLKFFNLLAGNETLVKQIESGMTECEIRRSWAPSLKNFMQLRSKYLLYP